MTILESQCQNKPAANIAKAAFDLHAQYKEPVIKNRRFKHRDIVPLIEELKKNPMFQVKTVGQSIEGRDIYLIKAGTGKTKVMLWSQMHGDESTATMALFDFFNFLQKPDALDEVKKKILQNTTLYFVPMLNPDGAEAFKRRNAYDIDLNRDALRLQSPEARLLKSLRDSLNPEFGFNLHDQSRLYTVGTTNKPATISFLAPAFDYAQTVNEVRGRAMHTIVGMNEGLQTLIPGQVAKYSDDHEPRAFGDNIQKWGTSVILIESGGYNGDQEKQEIRKLNFATITSALHLIATKEYTNYKLEDYVKIPQNERYLYDLVIRKVHHKDKSGHPVLLDVGVNRSEIPINSPKGFFHRATVEEIGDMSVFHGYEEVNGEGLTLEAGKILDKPIKQLRDLTPERVKDLLQQGYTTVRLENFSAGVNPTELPLNIIRVNGNASHTLGLGRGANFVLRAADGKVRYAIVNGFVYDMQGAKPSLLHGVVL
ncbi:M14 family zinc carboxypeptidase [Rufibacter roseus]